MSYFSVCSTFYCWSFGSSCEVTQLSIVAISLTHIILMRGDGSDFVILTKSTFDCVFFGVGVNPVQYLGAFVSELNECYTINV